MTKIIQSCQVLGSLALVTTLLTISGTAPARAQTLKQCVVGQRVIDGAGATGVITRADGGFCYISFDDGRTASRMFYVLRPASGESSAATARLQDGEYDCAIMRGDSRHLGVVPMGRMDVRGDTYRFRPLGTATGGFASFSADADGTLHWNGRMGALDEPPSVIVRSYRTPEGLNIEYRVKPGTADDIMSCRRL